jgi:hypothetical protein
MGTSTAIIQSVSNSMSVVSTEVQTVFTLATTAA